MDHTTQQVDENNMQGLREDDQPRFLLVSESQADATARGETTEEANEAAALAFQEAYDEAQQEVIQEALAELVNALWAYVATHVK